MIAVDSNLLVFAHRRESPWHERALAAVTVLAESPDPWGIPWPCLHEFYAVVTSTKCKPPSTVQQAWGMIDSLVALDNVRLLGEGVDHLATLKRIVYRGKVMDGMVHDARIAAICLVHQVQELWTADRDFSRFPELKTRNPLN